MLRLRRWLGKARRKWFVLRSGSGTCCHSRCSRRRRREERQRRRVTQAREEILERGSLVPRVIWPRGAARHLAGRTTSSKLLENSWPRELRGAQARAADATPESLRNEMQVGRRALTRRAPISRRDPTTPEAGLRAVNDCHDKWRSNNFR